MITLISVFIAGLLQAAMQSFNGVLQGYIGLFGTSLMTHLVGGILLILYIVLIQKEKIRLWPMPLHLYSAGFFGLALVASSSLCVAQIGAALTTCLNISGQLVFSILIDHFGLMGVKQVRFRSRRLLCLLTILAGLMIVNLGGRSSLTGPSGKYAFIYILLAFVMGGINVYSKTVNFQATKHLGTSNGTLVNYVVASLLSLLLLLSFEHNYAHVDMFVTTPTWLYLGGVCGVIALVINVISLRKINLFQSTILLLVGQLTGSTVLDAVLFQDISLLKLIGVIIVAIGIIWDKKETATPSP